MTSDYDRTACQNAPDHLDPRPIDAHRWRCGACGAEWQETISVEIEAVPTRSGVALQIGSQDFPLDHDTAHRLIDKLQEALRRSATEFPDN